LIAQIQFDQRVQPTSADERNKSLDIELDEEAIRERIAQFKIEHHDLDDAISRLSEGPYVDQIQIRRLKKRKLQLKDAIAKLESKLIPDLNA